MSDKNPDVNAEAPEVDVDEPIEATGETPADA